VDKLMGQSCTKEQHTFHSEDRGILPLEDPIQLKTQGMGAPATATSISVTGEPQKPHALPKVPTAEPHSTPHQSTVPASSPSIKPESAWKAVGSAPKLHAAILESMKRLKPRKYSDFPGVASYGGSTVCKLMNNDTGEYFEGYIQQGIPHGWGYMICQNGDYLQGLFLNAKPAKHIRHIATLGTVYEGDFQQGRNGRGSLFEADGSIIKCDNWLNGLPEGEMIKQDKSGKVVFSGITNRKGHQGRCITYTDKSTIHADYEDGVVRGPAIKIYPDGSMYVGAIDANFLEEGQGIFTFIDGRKFEGPFSKGKANGKGKLITNTGKILEQKWLEGKRV
jgi:hypothetical protein